MRFSAKGEYGVRVMVELARHYGAGPVALNEIADREVLPLAYLEQIVAELRTAGLVTARRGRHGGYALSRSPDTMPMTEIVGLLEGGISPMVCIPGDPAAEDVIVCAHQDYCTTRVLWLRIRDSIVDVLATTTLADLVTEAGAGRRGTGLGPRGLVVHPAHVECQELIEVAPKLPAG